MSQRISVEEEQDPTEDEVGPGARAHPADNGGSNNSSPTSEASKHSTDSFTQSQIEDSLENGRRYASNSYYMPADEAEQTRLAIVHQAYLPLLDGSLTLTTIPRAVRRILDIGTSTADWAIAVAERFPNAEVTATDITSAFQPSSAPPNLFFELDDAQDEWTYAEPFDIIHIRGLMGAFRDWNHIYTEAYKHLRSGGLLEVADFGPISLTVEPPNSSLGVWNGAMRAACERSGMAVDLEHLKRPVFEAAGLSVTKTKTVTVPLGTWADDPRKRVAGKMALIAALEGFEAMSLRLLTRWGDWSAEGVRELCGRVREEVRGEGAKPLVMASFTVARKML